MSDEKRIDALRSFTQELMAHLPLLCEQLLETPQLSREETPVLPTDSQNDRAPNEYFYDHTLCAETTETTPSSKLHELAKIRLSMNGKNYSTWKTVIDILLLAEPNCHKAAHGDLPSTDPAYEKANSSARAILLNSLEVQLIEFKFRDTISKVTAASIYKEITKEFDNITKMAQHSAMTQLQTLNSNQTERLLKMYFVSENSFPTLWTQEPRSTTQC